VTEDLTTVVEPVATDATTTTAADTSTVGDTTTTTSTPVVALDVAFGAEASATLNSGGAPTADGGPSGHVVAAVATDDAATKAAQEFYKRAVDGSLDALRSEGAWSTFGSAAGRFGPWVALLGIAFVLEALARSAMRDRLRAKTVKPS
jgi:hypothetical protein